MNTALVTANIALITAIIALIAAVIPHVEKLWKWYKGRTFDELKAHREELIDRAEWLEGRVVRLTALREQLHYFRLYEKPPDHFKLTKMISKLDRSDREWTRQVQDPEALETACQDKEEECRRNAEQCREWADQVVRGNAGVLQ